MQVQKSSIFSLLSPYHKKIETKLRESIPALGQKTRLRDACEYALLSSGKRFRPILVYMMADALGKERDVTSAALAVEYFHTASMIADDLPCMDNDDMRRNQPTLHKAHGEGIALLATYALIAAGYELLAKNSQEIKRSHRNNAADADRICVLALENATYNTGLAGASGGQFLDMYPPNLTKETIFEVIQKKTVSLFEISFVLGWLYGGGDIHRLDVVKEAAKHFGTAFQIADDLDDMEQDIKNKRLVNIACVLGKENAEHLFHEEIQLYLSTLKSLNLSNSPFEQMGHILAEKVKLSD